MTRSMTLVNLLSQTPLVVPFLAHGLETALLVRFRVHWLWVMFGGRKKTWSTMLFDCNLQLLNLNHDMDLGSSFQFHRISIFPIMSGWRFLTFSLVLCRFRFNFDERTKGMASAPDCRGTNTSWSIFVARSKTTNLIMRPHEYPMGAFKTWKCDWDQNPKPYPNRTNPVFNPY